MISKTMVLNCNQISELSRDMIPVAHSKGGEKLATPPFANLIRTDANRPEALYSQVIPNR